MKQIPLSRGKFAIVDDEDYPELSKYRWRCTNNGYAARNIPEKNRSKRGCVLMHRQIAKAMENQMVDHSNHDTVDNRRANLRICDDSQNNWNTRVSKNNKLSVKGVCIYRGSYRATLVCRGKRVLDRQFKTLEEAKQARDTAAHIHHGEFSHS
jgi:cytochrome c biogenesis protein ResB